jgi:hypothetical protein
MPLPDFFIGAQAEVMGWKIATRDQGRFEKYFPAVVLVTPWRNGKTPPILQTLFRHSFRRR